MKQHVTKALLQADTAPNDDSATLLSNARRVTVMPIANARRPMSDDQRKAMFARRGGGGGRGGPGRSRTNHDGGAPTRAHPEADRIRSPELQRGTPEWHARIEAERERRRQSEAIAAEFARERAEQTEYDRQMQLARVREQLQRSRYEQEQGQQSAIAQQHLDRLADQAYTLRGTPEGDRAQQQYDALSAATHDERNHSWDQQERRQDETLSGIERQRDASELQDYFAWHTRKDQAAAGGHAFTEPPPQARNADAQQRRDAEINRLRRQWELQQYAFGNASRGAPMTDDQRKAMFARMGGGGGRGVSRAINQQVQRGNSGHTPGDPVPWTPEIAERERQRGIDRTMDQYSPEHQGQIRERTGRDQLRSTLDTARQVLELLTPSAQVAPDDPAWKKIMGGAADIAVTAALMHFALAGKTRLGQMYPSKARYEQGMREAERMARENMAAYYASQGAPVNTARHMAREHMAAYAATKARPLKSMGRIEEAYNKTRLGQLYPTKARYEQGMREAERMARENIAPYYAKLGTTKFRTSPPAPVQAQPQGSWARIEQAARLTPDAPAADYGLLHSGTISQAVAQQKANAAHYARQKALARPHSHRPGETLHLFGD